MKQVLIALVLILVIGLGSMFYFIDSTDNVNSQSSNTNTNPLIPRSTESNINNIINEDNEPETIEEKNQSETNLLTNNIPKTFVITGENFNFYVDGKNNANIIVKKGDLVRIEFTSTKGLHDWVVDKFNVATSRVRNTDDMTFVEFVADEIGTFEYYCSVGSHRTYGMKGKFIVE